MNEELLGNYPDSRYLWSQAAEMDKKSKDAGAKAAFYQEVIRNTATLYPPPGSAPKAAKPEAKTAAKATSSTPSGTYADRETVQLQIDRVTKEKYDYITASGGKGDDAVLSWYDNQLRNLYSAKSALPTEATREDILLQALGGNYYTGRPTLGGTAGQIGLGLLGADLPADIRDLAYDLEHRDSIPKKQLALDAFALLPVVGGLKYADDAIAGAKAAANLSTAAKHADNLMDTGADLVYNGVKQFSKADLMPSNLMDELAASGKKYTPQDVIMVTKNANGDLLWLEQGHKGKDGLIHILEDHQFDFKAQEYPPEEIPSLLNKILSTEPVRVRPKNGGMEAIYNYEGHNYTIGYGTNGYIVSFYPSKAGK